MKLKSSTKKVLLMSAVMVVAVCVLSGCSVPTETDAAGNQVVKQITIDTTFKQTMDSENWFSAILVWPMAQVLNHLQPSIGVVGAIAVLTITVNAILLIFTLKSTIASQQMQLLQPEMERIQRKYEGKDDNASKMRQAQEMQNLYKKYNVNPGSMMLVTFLQFPIIIAMYQAVQRATAIKTGTFAGMSLELTPLAGMRQGMWGYLGIFIVMGLCQTASMLTPQWITKHKAKQEAEKHHRKPENTQNSQTKIMQIYMLVMILIFGLMWPAAMSIYWSVYSLVNIAKTLLVQLIINKRAEKEGVKA